MVQPDPNIENSFREIIIPSTLRDAKRPEHVILKEVERCGFGQEAVFAIKLALEEAMTNAVKHGNGSDPSKLPAFGGARSHATEPPDPADRTRHHADARLYG